MKTIITTLAGTFLIASAAMAQPPGPPPGGHGQDDPGQAVLRALDTDHNHEISAEEIANASSALRQLDMNGDGKLSDADIAGGGQADARRGGRNGRTGQGAGNSRGEGRGPRGPGGAQGEGGPPSPEQFVSRAMEFDADGDGKLNGTELATFAQQMGPPTDGRGGRGRQRVGRQDRPQRSARPSRG